MPPEMTSAQADTNAATQGAVTDAVETLFGDNKAADAATTTAKADAQKADAVTTEGAPEGDKSKAADAGEQIQLTVPEGFQIPAEAQAEFLKVLQSDATPQEKANQLIKMHTDALANMQTGFDAAIDDHVATTAEAWAKEVESDKEIGGAKFKENVAVANKALNHFGSDSLKSFLKESGLANHPEMVKLFFRIGNQISEGQIVTGAASAGSQPRREDILYGNN